MCDTIVAPAHCTADGITLFGKNSDREPNEAQYIVQQPAREHPEDSQQRCTYLTIPQVRQTNAVLLCKPFWMWGAEMGANEHGLVIGNEAVFTKIPFTKKNALTGMDLIRLALERAHTAAAAVTTITDLIDRYDQGGNCGYESRLYYHNSFILADPNEVWLLETAGKHWAARRLDEVYAISNGLTIENQWDRASEGLVSHATARKWCRSEDDFSFSRCYSDFLFTYFSSSRYRRNRALELLNRKNGQLCLPDMAAILRDHGTDTEADWKPDRGLVKSTICNHAAFGPIRISQTTGSLLACLPKDRPPIFFITGTAAPCTGIFKPIWIDTPLHEEDGRQPQFFQEESLFWKHEQLHRQTLINFSSILPVYAADRDQLESRFFAEAWEKSSREPKLRKAFARDCFRQSGQKIDEWLHLLKETNIPPDQGWLYSQAWKRRSRRAKITAGTR